MRRYWVVVFAMSAALGAAHARTTVAVFPLRNAAGNPLYDWIGYSVPEYVSRTVHLCENMRMWDPIALFAVDTSCHGEDSDSLLALHQKRWEWDAAVDGKYSLRGDSIVIELRVLRFRNSALSKSDCVLRGVASNFFALGSSVVFGFLGSIGCAPTRSDSVRIRCAPAKSIEAYALYAAGFGYEMRQDPAAALSAYFRAVDKEEDSPLALLHIGAIYASSMEQEQAQTYFDKALESSPGDPAIVAAVAHYYGDQALLDKGLKFIKDHAAVLSSTSEGLTALGSIYMASGEYQRGSAMLAKAVAAGPSNLETEFALGKSFFATGQFDLAVDVFNRLINFRPSYMPYYSYLGTAYRQVGRYMESVSILQSALGMAPRDLGLVTNLARTYFDLKWYLEAEQVLMHALELNPEMTSLMLNLGVLYLHMNELDKARSVLSKAARVSHNTQLLYNNQGNVFFAKGDITRAIKMYRKADRSGKKSQDILYNMALAFLAIEQYEHAFECFEEILSMAPGRLEVLERQADVSLKMGNDTRAEECYRAVLTRSPFEKNARANLLDILRRQKRYEEMADVCEGYLKQFPGDKYFRLRLAAAYVAMEWHDVALMKYQEILKDFPQDCQGYLGMGRCLLGIAETRNSSKYGEAAEFLTRAAGMNPKDPEAYYLLGDISMNYRRDKGAAIAYWRKALNLTSDPLMKEELKKRIAEAQQS
jgi:tetratricopeptide (TPR) repeat protein